MSTARQSLFGERGRLTLIEVEADRQALSEAILSTLSDTPRSGTPVTYTAQMVIVGIRLAIGRLKPRRSHRTRHCKGHFRSQCGTFFKRRPIASSCGERPPDLDKEAFYQQSEKVCTLYQSAPAFQTRRPQ